MQRAAKIVGDSRTRRVAIFTEQLSLFVAQRCLESSVTTALIDRYMDHLFGEMVRSSEPLSVLDLLSMMTSERFQASIFNGYVRFLRAPPDF